MEEHAPIYVSSPKDEFSVTRKTLMPVSQTLRKTLPICAKARNAGPLVQGPGMAARLRVPGSHEEAEQHILRNAHESVPAVVQRAAQQLSS